MGVSQVTIDGLPGRSKRKGGGEFHRNSQPDGGIARVGPFLVVYSAPRTPAAFKHVKSGSRLIPGLAVHTQHKLRDMALLLASM